MNKVSILTVILFYPRSPCGERRVTPELRPTFLSFLSTLSLRRATRHRLMHRNQGQLFYPRSPCGERLLPGRLGFLSFHFLSTLSLRRATQTRSEKINRNIAFLSTLSLRRATQAQSLKIASLSFSIHALLAESDLKTPCVKLSIEVFLSTLSLRRATLMC